MTQRSCSVLAYLAGIVDGEGSIYISKCKGADHRLPVYQGLVCIRMTNDKPLRLLKKTFGGIFKPYSLTSKKKKYFYWCVYGNTAVTVVTILMPFLRVKKRQAKLLLKFRGAVLSRKKRAYSPLERKKLETLRIKMRQLNA